MTGKKRQAEDRKKMTERREKNDRKERQITGEDKKAFHGTFRDERMRDGPDPLEELSSTVLFQVSNIMILITFVSFALCM
jgi:hypothetical protein